MEKTRFKDIKATKYFDGEKPVIGSSKFTDKHFPPNYTSLVGLNKHKKEYKSDSDLPESLKKYKSITWKRISDFIDFPMLFNGKITVNDIQQGGLGNCYWLAALSSLAAEPRWIYNLFITKTYNKQGLYELQLFVNGEWQIVIVDDYIPCQRSTGQPKFTHARGGEIWMILLEKAWAKVNRSYNGTVGGYGRESFLALTSYSTSYIERNSKIPNLMFDSLKTAMRKGHFVQTGSKALEKKENGIVGGHAYSVIDAFEIKNKRGQKEKVIRLRNPHGKLEWTGTWTRKGFVPDNNKISNVDLRKKGLGLFYIPYSEFILYFKYAYICCVEYSSKVKSFQLKKGQVEKGQCFHLRLEQRANLNIEVCYKKKQFSKIIETLVPVIAVAKIEKDKSLNLLINKKQGKICWENFNLDKGEYLVWVHPNYYQTLSRYNGISVRFASKGSFYAEKTCKDAYLKVITSLVCQTIKRTNHKKEYYGNSSYLGSQIGVYYRKNVHSTSFSVAKTKSKGFLAVNYPGRGKDVIIAPGETLGLVGLFNQNTASHRFTPFASKPKMLHKKTPNTLGNVKTIPKEAFSKNLKECSDGWYDFIMRSEREMKLSNKFPSNKEKKAFFAKFKTIDKQACTVLSHFRSKENDNKYEIIKSSKGTYYGQVGGHSIFAGIGVFMTQKGSFKVGNWINGNLTGAGKEYKKGKLAYSGNFKNSKYQGKGTFYKKGKIAYVGVFSEGLANGKGKLYLKDKATWEGQLEKGHPIGVGKYTDKRGKVSQIDLNKQ